MKRTSPLLRPILTAETWRLGSAGPLTCRELEIFKTISDGLTNAEVRVALGISVQTVKNHVTMIVRKLAASDRTQAVVLALRCG